MTRASNQNLLDLIGETYDAALDESLWTGLAPRIARAFDSMSVAIRMRDATTGNAPLLSRTDNMEVPPAIAADYQTYYWQHDIWANRASSLGLSRVFTSKDLIADAQLERSEFYQDWLRKFRIFYIVGAILPVAPGETCSFGIHRERAYGNYDEEDKRPVSQYLPHLKRALQIRRRLLSPTMERKAALDALERTGIATLAVTRNGRLLYANAYAEKLLAEGDALRVTQGQLATSCRSASAKLAAAIEYAIATASNRSGAPSNALSIPRVDRLPLGVLVAPFRAARGGFGAPTAAALLFVRDPEQPTPSHLALRALFGLTPAEASVAGALAEGMSVEYIAASRRISLNTTRTHLKNILAKTRTSRQAELVALILRSIATLSAD